MENQDLENSTATNSSVLPDGRRAKENITTVVRDDGSKEYTHEVLEETVPMRVTERLRRTFRTVPVEECIEKVAEDGSVHTTIRKLDPELLNLNREPTTLEDVVREVRALRERIAQPVQMTVPPPIVTAQREPSFLEAAKAKFGGRKATDEPMATGEPVPEKANSTNVGEFSLTTLAWIAFAVAAGLVTYSLF